MQTNNFWLDQAFKMEQYEHLREVYHKLIAKEAKHRDMTLTEEQKVSAANAAARIHEVMQKRLETEFCMGPDNCTCSPTCEIPAPEIPEIDLDAANIPTEITITSTEDIPEQITVTW